MAATVPSVEDETVVRSKRLRTQDKQYFDSYAHLGIHEDMIKDSVRTDTYRSAILKNPSDFKGKVVLDVGAGSGILSFFCAQAGAKKVYAVEASDIADLTKVVVEQNRMSDRIIVIKGKMEDTELPEKVDVIVSEWMGYFLLYESMLESVIVARDKWLKPEGKMFPSEANMYISPFTDEEYIQDKTEFWRDVYGIDYSYFIPHSLKMNFQAPQIELIHPQNELSYPSLFKTINTKTITWQDLQNFTADFSCKSLVVADFHGFISYFDVVFHGADVKPYRLSTAPGVGYTHWKHTLFLFEEPINITQDDVVSGSISIQTNHDNKRFLNIEINATVGGAKQAQKKFVLR
jgi:protein arginine N-methyltransferase 6